MSRALGAGVPESNLSRAFFFFKYFYYLSRQTYFIKFLIARYSRVLHLNLILPRHINIDMAESKSLNSKAKHGNRYKKCNSMINHVLEIQTLVTRPKRNRRHYYSLL